MKRSREIRTLFLDIGGVLLTDGWQSESRKLAAKTFRLDFSEMDLVRQLKAKHGLKIIVLSNEARELNAYRIHKFKLDEFVDAFVSSCFVHLRKPDADIFRLALDIAQTPAQQIIYIENTAMFVQIAESMGIQGILHMDCKSTRPKLLAFGLATNKRMGADS
jgi:putative hydrolase of the HAD superfamily